MMESRHCGKQNGNSQCASSIAFATGWTDQISQCTKSIYPFHDGKYEDFEPIFEQLIKVGSPPVWGEQTC